MHEYSAAFNKRYYVIDSTFYYYLKSYKIYENLKDSLGAGKLMLNIAILQKNVHDYSGSEISSFRALDFLKNTANKRRISSIFNNLGIVYNNLKNFDKAIKYHSKAFELRIKIKNPLYAIQSLNNIGKSYKDFGNYKKAIIYFEQALLNDSILNANLKTKATLLDNLAHTKFKMNLNDNYLKDLNLSLSLREKENDQHGIIISCIHLAEFHKKQGNIKKAVAYIERAEKIAKKTKKYRDYLSSLEFMGEIYSGDMVKNKFKNYVKMRDSLELVDKAYKEQFINIKYEIEEKNKINQQLQSRNKTKLLLILLILILFIILAYNFVITLRKKQRNEQELNTIINDLKISQEQAIEEYESILIDSDFMELFKKHIMKKFNISKSLFIFWEYQSKGLTEAEIANEIQSVTEGAIKKRRTNLYKKLKAYFEHYDQIDKLTSVIIYQNEFEKFKKLQSKSKP